MTGPAGSRWTATLDSTGLEGRKVADDEALRVATFGVFDAAEQDVRDAYASTAVSVDVVFTDGSRLSGTGATDQYGTPLEPRAKYDAKTAWPDQWQSRTVDLPAGRTIDRIELSGWLPPRISAQGAKEERTSTGFVDRVEIIPSAPVINEPIDHVKTTRGTFSTAAFSRGNCAPLVSRPNGFVFGVPMTDAGDRRWPYLVPAEELGGRRRRRAAGASAHAGLRNLAHPVTVDG